MARPASTCPRSLPRASRPATSTRPSCASAAGTRMPRTTARASMTLRGSRQRLDGASRNRYTKNRWYRTPSYVTVTSRRIMGRTNIVLDDRLVREGLRRFKCRSKRDLVHLALTELLKSARRRDLLSLRGQVKWEGDLAELRRLRP